MAVPMIAAARVAAGTAGRGASARAAAAQKTARAASSRAPVAEGRTAGRGASERAAEAQRSARAASVRAVKDTPKHRISILVGSLMLSLSAIIDMVQFLLDLTVFLAVASLLLTFTGVPTFGIWFKLHDVSYFGGKKAGLKLIAVVGGVITELIPILNALPATTASVTAVILISRLEDREAANDNAPAAERGNTRLSRAA